MLISNGTKNTKKPSQQQVPMFGWRFFHEARRPLVLPLSSCLSTSCFLGSRCARVHRSRQSRSSHLLCFGRRSPLARRRQAPRPESILGGGAERPTPRTRLRRGDGKRPRGNRIGKRLNGLSGREFLASTTKAVVSGRTRRHGYDLAHRQCQFLAANGRRRILSARDADGQNAFLRA